MLDRGRRRLSCGGSGCVQIGGRRFVAGALGVGRRIRMVLALVHLQGLA